MMYRDLCIFVYTIQQSQGKLGQSYLFSAFKIWSIFVDMSAICLSISDTLFAMSALLPLGVGEPGVGTGAGAGGDGRGLGAGGFGRGLGAGDGTGFAGAPPQRAWTGNF